MLPVLLLTVPTFAIAGLLPGSAASPTASSLHSKCTFTLWHRQQWSIDYVKLNTIIDHANNMTIGVASHRPATAFNSYTRLDRERGLAVAGLLDDARLSVIYAGDGALGFQVGRREWSTEESTEEVDGERGEGKRREEAWCDASEWESGVDRRERRLDCVFPCEEVDVEDLQNDEYVGAPGRKDQARILS